MADTLSVALQALRSRITAVFPAQIRTAIEPLTDEQIWWRPNEASNSIGNLVLHLSGSLNHFLNRQLGGIEYHRDREAEFAAQGPMPKAELLAIFDGMVGNAERTFETLTVDRLGQPSPEQKLYTLVIEDLIAIATHLSTHTGQILWIAKMFGGKPLEDLWMRAHRQHGGWKARP